MSKDIKNLWNRLVESRLLNQNTCDLLRGQFESTIVTDQKDVSMLVDWLREQKAISPFQADILNSGIEAQFRYGNYRIRDPLIVRNGRYVYEGNHELTGHPVTMEFFPGQSHEDLAVWRQAKRWVKVLRAKPQLNLARTYDAVATPEYRFAVSELPRGQRLSALLPENSKVKWRKATDIVSQVASAVNHSQQLGVLVGDVTSDMIWLGSNQVQIPALLRATVATKTSIEDSADRTVESLGRLWLKLTTGSGDGLEFLGEYKVPKVVVDLVTATQKQETDRRMLLQKLIKLGEQVRTNEEPARITPRKTQAAYFNWMRRTPESVLAGQPQALDAVDLPFGQTTPLWKAGDVRVAANESTAGVGTQNGAPKRSLWGPVLGSLALVGVLIAFVAVLTSNQNNAPGNSAAALVANRNRESQISGGLAMGEIDSSETSVNSGEATPSVSGDLAEDDGEMLWEAATAGSPLEFTHVPYSPALAFYVRWADLNASDAGSKTLQALGPVLNQRIEEWAKSLGVATAEIKSILLTLHSGDEFAYEPFTVVTLNEARPVEEIVAAWGETKTVGERDDEMFFRRADGTCYVVLSSGEDVTQFGIGSAPLIREAIELRGIDAASGAMKRMAVWADQDAMVNVLFLAPGLFNDEGQKLMSGPLQALNRELSVSLDKNIRGGLLALHVDDGIYVELRLDSTIDLKPDAAEQHVRNLLDHLVAFVGKRTESGNAPEYWQAVSTRYPAMLQRLRDLLRFGVEDRNLIGNGWLPEVALHNIVAGTELFLSLGNETSAVVTNAKTIPQTIEQLLELPRDLSVATNPDLIVLIRNLEQEIRDDFGGLPFEFEIRLLGADLAKQGITQNQRPSDIEMTGQPLSKILTEIMVKANPDKNISGPSDPMCKMVWVVESDPDNLDRKIIMITTRDAAQEKGYALPADFR